jgi:hypothetical protein
MLSMAIALAFLEMSILLSVLPSLITSISSEGGGGFDYVLIVFFIKHQKDKIHQYASLVPGY